MDFDDFTDDQKDVIKYGKGALLVEAGPGSGKTTVIIERIKHIIKTKEKLGEEVDPKSFLVITFTNKATDNLKYKLRKEFSNDFVSKMQISTIHSFCFEYLKNVCSNKDDYSALNLIDDDASEKKSLVIQNSLNCLGFIDEYTIFDYQIPAVVKKFGEYTGFKVDTTTLLEKISDSREISEEYRDFAKSMSFFNKKRLDDHDKPIKNEISKIKRQLKKEIKKLEEIQEEGLTDEKAEEIVELEKKIAALECDIQGLSKELYKDSWYNACYYKIAESYPKYLELLDKKNYVDYDYLQRKTLDELKKDSKHPYKVIFVDEFQDTDPLQFRIFKNLNDNCDYFTAVGDVDQHIYAFRSSFNDFFDEFKRLEKEHKSLPLNVNFRSTENIVKLTEKFIKPQRKGQSNKNMKNHRTDCNNPVFLIENADSDEEANKIYEIIKYLKENNKINDYSDVAILYRKHSDTTIANLIDKFEETGIEFSVKGRKDLSKQNEVQTILTLMWYISRKTDLGRVPSKDELKELNLKALCGEYFETSFFSFDDSTKEYLCKLQDSYYIDIIKKEFGLPGIDLESEALENKALMRGKTRWENKYREENGKDPSLEEYLIYKAGNVKDRHTQDELYELFEDFQMPIVDIEKITNPTDNEFFRHLDDIINEIKQKDSQTIEEETEEVPRLDEAESDEKKEKPLTILDVFYKLVALSNLYDYELEYEEIANMALLTQTISNYETFISDNDFRGVIFFLKRSIENYDSYQKEGNGVQLMTIHGAKGLEFPVTFITSLEKDNFPPIPNDPNRESDYIYGTATYYTPNECLEYKKIINKDGECEILSIEEENRRSMEEEDRVFYVAMTRAEDLLILSTIGEVPEQVEKIRTCTENFDFDKLSKVEIPSAFKEPDEEKEMEQEFESLEEPVVLNYSRYTQYISCPFKYDLSYNLGFRRIGSAKAANIGSAFHNVMEELNLKLIDGIVVDKEELLEITEKHYKSMFDIEKDIEEYEKFKYNVENYYYTYSVNRETLESEFNFELFVDNYMLNGAIDLIFRDSDGEVKILDYKYADFKEDHIDGYIKQSYIYTSALRRIPEYAKYNIKKAIIHFVKDDHLYPVDIDEEIMEKEFERMALVAGNIHDDVYEKEPEKDDECTSCSYRYFCKPDEYAHELYDV